MADELIHELSAAYALDALDEHDRVEFEEHLAGCERCRGEVAALSQTAVALAFAAPEAQPPADLGARIVAKARAERPNVVPLPSRWTRPLAAVAAVAACVAVGLGVWAGTLQHRLDRATSALRTVDLQTGSGSLVVGGDGDAALVLSGLSPAPSGKTYEAWVMRDGEAAAAGTFAGSVGTTVVPLTRRVPAGAQVAVTVERAGGVAHPTQKPVVVSARA
jgi:anti-sigma-K factor RskA